jgi:hypothetical protein
MKYDIWVSHSKTRYDLKNIYQLITTQINSDANSDTLHLPVEEDPLSVIYTKVGFSFNIDFAENAIAERFFEEDKLVGFLEAVV